jgi:hypothetical protein
MPKLNTPEKPARKKVAPARPARSGRRDTPIPYRLVSDEENERMAQVFASMGSDLLAIAAKLALRGVPR